MLFRRKREIEPEQPSTQEETESPQLQAHKYSIQFDISPEISYLNDQLCRLFPEFLPLFHEFPEGAWISQQTVDEGLDVCKVSFWVFAEEPDVIKEFSIWFETFFRNEVIIDLLERFVKHALDDSDNLEITLVDWSREHVTAEEARKIIKQELRHRPAKPSD